MTKFDEFLGVLETELVDFAKYSWNTYRDSAINDGKAYVEKMKSDLERWTKLLGTRDLTPDDFEWLMVGKRDLAELVALKQIGLAKVTLDRFINGLIDTIVSTAFKVFL